MSKIIGASHGPVMDHEIVFTDNKQFYCDGGEFGHPRVYFTIGTEGFVMCSYCNIKYVYKKNDE